MPAVGRHWPSDDDDDDDDDDGDNDGGDDDLELLLDALELVLGELGALDRSL